MQRADNGGRSWSPVGNEVTYASVPGTHQWSDGTLHPWEFVRVGHFKPSPREVDTVYAGVEDAALLRSTDGGGSWQELAGLRDRSAVAATPDGASRSLAVTAWSSTLLAELTDCGSALTPTCHGGRYRWPG